MTDYSYPLLQRIGSRLRKSPVDEIDRCLKLAQQHQLPFTAQQLEAHHLAGGRISAVIEALILAKERGVRLPVLRACVQDLTNGKTRSVKEWVEDCCRRGVTDLEREPLA